MFESTADHISITFRGVEDLAAYRWRREVEAVVSHRQDGNEGTDDQPELQPPHMHMSSGGGVTRSLLLAAQPFSTRPTAWPAFREGPCARLPRGSR